MRRSLVVLTLIACVFTTRSGAAQPLRLSPPFPPLPLTPLPPPSFDISPTAPHSETPPQLPFPTTESTLVEASMRASHEADPEALRRSRSHETWYGWQTLTCDAAAIATLLVGNAVVVSLPPNSSTADPRPVVFGATSLGIYIGVPPVIHLSHGAIKEAMESLGLRIALPIAGFALGSLVGLHDPRQSVDAAFGEFAGAALAAVIDASALAWERWQTSESSPGAAVVSTHASF